MEILSEFSAAAATRAGSCKRLEGRKILVVGGGQIDFDDNPAPMGNGRAISILCAREGAQVCVADRNLASATQTVDQIGMNAHAIRANVAYESEIAAMIDESIATMGGLDGIVLNVGIGSRTLQLANVTTKEWDTIFAVNTRAHALAMKHALPMLPNGAAVVFISSISSLRSFSQMPAYDASKAALLAIMRQAAAEGAPRQIRANALVLGLMDTAIGRMGSQHRAQRAAMPIPLGRQGTAWESAYAALFLLSHESSYTTGQSLVVDGGVTGI